MFFRYLFSFFAIATTLFSPLPAAQKKLPLTSINIVDHNNLSETITTKERLKKYERVNFCAPQPYQKVMRVFRRDSNGNARAIITSYHPNGQLKQHLEVLNNRAFGSYNEWFANGQKSLQARVVGGLADLSSKAQNSWLFDGKSLAWNEDGILSAEIFYQKGVLCKESTLYHPNGAVWKKIPYNKGAVDGTIKIFIDTGALLQESSFSDGTQNGPSRRLWPTEQNSLACEEIFDNGLLKSGVYYDKKGSIIASIKKGEGQRALFGKDSVLEIQEIHNGQQDGKVKQFAPDGSLHKVFTTEKGKKVGVETTFFPPQPFSQKPPQPKTSVFWHQGLLQGTIKTWFSSGQQESQSEMSNNIKHGLCTAWYKDGSVMLFEEYQQGKLTKGKYLRKGERDPVSFVTKGSGEATLFDAEGNFLKKITYKEGVPEL